MTDTKDFYRDILNCQGVQPTFISKGKCLLSYLIFTLIINTYFLILYYRCNILRSLTSYLCFSPVSFAFFNLSKAADRPPLSLFSLRERDFANPCSTTNKSKCLFFVFISHVKKSVHICILIVHILKNRDRFAETVY